MIKRIELFQLYEDAELFLVKERRNKKTTFEGENREGVLIICNNGKGGITPDEKLFLDRILNSVKLDLNDVALVNSGSVSFFHQLKSEIHFQKIILFGVAPLEIGLNINCTNYHPVDFQDTELLPCDNLAQLGSNEHSKALLWNALKKMLA